MSQQLEFYKEYQSKLAAVARENTSTILSEALYIVSTGSSDFVQNYYINPWLNKLYSPDDYSTFLVGIFSNFVKVGPALSRSRIPCRLYPLPVHRRTPKGVVFFPR